ncbi:MAG: hypothetical protein MJ206_04010 [Bacilli bacterium]|nr:hypothetical protein [Bacilli bacterium]
MKNKFLSIFAIAPFLLACSKGVPSKGYEKWKKIIQVEYSGVIEYKSCNYAYIKNIPETPELNQTCFYYSTFSVNSVSYYSYYFYYEPADEVVPDMEEGKQGQLYRQAVEIIRYDSSVGELGTL